MHDAVGVDVERDLDLRHAAGRRRQPGQLELPEGVVVRGHLALALQDVDLHLRLAVRRGGERLGLARGNGGVALDEGGHDAPLGLDAQRQRGHVEQQDVLHLAAQHTGLQGGADGDDLIRVDALGRLLAAGQLRHEVDDGGHAR